MKTVFPIALFLTKVRIQTRLYFRLPQYLTDVYQMGRQFARLTSYREHPLAAAEV